MESPDIHWKFNFKTKIMKKSTIAILGAVVLIAIIGVLYDFSVDNKEVKLRNGYDAQLKVNESNYDKMWKVIKQTAQVSSKYEESFKEIYKPLMEGRYSDEAGQGALMKWIQEDNPELSTDLFADLNVAIEANRAQFDREQKKLTSIWEQHNNLMATKPSKWFINDDVVAIEHRIITSTKTEKVFEEGKDDDVDLFGGDK
jgi:hypothetical protein